MKVSFRFSARNGFSHFLILFALHCSLILLTCTLAAVCSGLLSCTASLTCLGCGFSADAAVLLLSAAELLAAVSRLSPLLDPRSLPEPLLLSSLPPGPGFPRPRPAMLQCCSGWWTAAPSYCSALALSAAVMYNVLTVRAW